MAKSEYCNYIIDLLSPIGSVSARSMFGGYGVYNNGLIFAVIVDDTLYFKVDGSNRQEYEAAGSTAFSYEAKGNKKVVMSYWQVPIHTLEDTELLFAWAEKSCKISAENKKPKQQKKPNPKRPIKNMYGLGKKSAEWLGGVGIKTEGDLNKLGAVATYKLLKAKYPKFISLNMLWGICGAIEGVHWKNIDKGTKEKLLLALDKN